jgi:hypothetical protein
MLPFAVWSCMWQAALPIVPVSELSDFDVMVIGTDVVIEPKLVRAST